MSEPPADEAEAVETALLFLVRRWAAASAAVSGTLPVAHYFLLRALLALGETTMGALADTLGLDASTVSRHVTALESQGRVTRQNGRGDRRRTLVAITREGAEEAERVRAGLVASVRGMTSSWSATEASVARLGLQLVCEAMTAGQPAR